MSTFATDWSTFDESLAQGEETPNPGNRAPFKMKAITAAEFSLQDYQTKELVTGLIAAFQPCILAGKMKTLKTSLLVALAVALVLARKFLGVFDVPEAQRVGFVSCESGLGVLQETFRRVCVGYDVDLSDLSGLVVSDTIPRLEDPACIVALTEFCTKNELDVLILDPAYLMLTGSDSGNVFSMGERLAALNRISAECGVTVILAHHLRKNRSADLQRHAPPEMEEMAWSGFAEFARQWVLLGRRCEYEDGSGLHNLWMRAGGSAGHNGLWGVDVHEGTRSDPGGRTWEVDVRDASEVVHEARDKQQEAKEAERDAKAETRLLADADKITKTIAKFPEGETKNVIKDAAGLPGGRFSLAFSKLLADGDVVPCEVFKGNRRTPYEGYTLKDE